MKTLLLLASLSAPAMATPVKTFGDWQVINSNGDLIATTQPITPSSHVLMIGCNPVHRNCYMKYTQTQGCDEPNNNKRHINWTAPDSNYSWSYPMLCDYDHQWTVISFYENSLPSFVHGTTPFQVGFADDPNSVNTYSTNGAVDAMRYVWGSVSNFNH
ncbi:hypothetical protein D5018_21050 [Parashewanella curva]|uniref:Uncharacterized protein n=1 Tax=Parashewanella curva TaxID=2338552 RepID=A0A3L8PT13_9GAMM|nr:hypothetical protein [Parashewanella curva]RLV57723.1 hypothetical protein D5018_21050 [Parashewanella curva]